MSLKIFCNFAKLSLPIIFICFWQANKPPLCPYLSNPSWRDSRGSRNRSKDREKSAILNGHFPHCVVSMATVVEGGRAKGTRERGERVATTVS